MGRGSAVFCAFVWGAYFLSCFYEGAFEEILGGVVIVFMSIASIAISITGGWMMMSPSGERSNKEAGFFLAVLGCAIAVFFWLYPMKKLLADSFHIYY